MEIFASINKPHIDIKAEEVFSIGSFPVTNSMLLGLIGLILVLAVFFAAAKTIKNDEKPGILVGFFLLVYEKLNQTVEETVMNKKVAKKVAPLAITMFFFIVINYWIGILPIVGPVTAHGVPIFRGQLADMNTTFALAIISMIMVQVYGFKILGFKGNVSKYLVNPFKDPMGFFVGILEIISEFSRLIALSLRLFGNVFAGEVLIIAIGLLAGMFSTVGLLPFYIFELFIGTIQAYIFFILTTVFITLGFSGHESHDNDESTPHSSHPSVEAKQFSSGG